MLFPIKSAIASVKEEMVLLRIGYFERWELYHNVRRDIKDLIAYTYVTSIDLTPTVSQKFRIGWLRFASDKNIEGKHEFSPLKSGFWKLVKMAGTGSFTGIFRFLGPATLDWLIGRYGNDWLKNFLP